MTNKNLRIVYINRYSPLPLEAGGALRIYSLWKALRKRGDIRLIILGSKPPLKVRQLLIEEGSSIYPGRIERTARSKFFRYVRAAFRGKNISAARFLSENRLQRIISELTDYQPDLIVLGDTFLSILTPRLATVGAKIIVDVHNIESVLGARIAAQQRNPLKKIFCYLTALESKNTENRYLRMADQIWSVSSVDAQYYRESLKLPDVSVVPNVIDMENYNNAEKEEPNTLVFSAWFRHWPNLDAAEYLIEMSKQLKNEGIQHKLILVGKDFPDELRKSTIGEEQIHITGKVPDVKPYIAKASVFVAPISAASGSNFKIIEAMALGKPVVTTPLGAEGLPIDAGKHALVKNSGVEFYESVKHLLADPAQRETLGKAGRALVTDKLSQHALEKTIDKLL